jgi:putative sigma-54 modulation protein
MDIHLCTRHLSTTDVPTANILRRVGFALDRFADRIQHLTLRLADVNGPKGGLGIAAMVEISLHRGGHLVLHGQDSDPGRAATVLVDRARQAIVRRLGRSARQRHRRSADDR